MRKPDEIAMFTRLRAEYPDAYGGPGREKLWNLWQEIGMARNRGYGILYKWSDRGWWEYGTSVHGGWFTAECPNTIE